ncbi:MULTISPECIES: hypothetical protein [Xanthomonas translucens group]|uniref:hypothetical protein n=1 Tax=Xanthomonas translucens group TaxID=3390202 RepID=UPI0005793C5F|nr:hypothetical protein [Xanthomonas translucens]UKE48830.1 hypothetical protein KHA79_09825 [Xanthomonas translucens pv. cerealis]UKE67921.1 hypothetical protein K8O61_10235 [Xanthomonas translucens pv. pistacia]
MIAVSIEALHAELQQLQQVLQGDDHALAERMVSEHDQHLRQYLQQAVSDVSRDGIGSLLKLQQAVIAQMLQARDEAGDWLRASRVSNNAARAYSQAGSLR